MLYSWPEENPLNLAKVNFFFRKKKSEYANIYIYIYDWWIYIYIWLMNFLLLDGIYGEASTHEDYGIVVTVNPHLAAGMQSLQ